MENTGQSSLISHSISSETVEESLRKISNRIKKQGDKPHASVDYQLKILEQLSQFDLGRFLLKNRGIDGYWTDYIVTHPWFGRKTGKNEARQEFSPLEDFILNKAPSVLATQQRFQLFLQENQKCVQNNKKLACIPCGMMGELLYLDYSNVSDLSLTGIDLDSNALKDARVLAEQKELSQHITLLHEDAWKLNLREEFDLISCNGLTIYEPNDDTVQELYGLFYRALKPGGRLVTSFLTPPPTDQYKCEWNMSKLRQDDLVLQMIIFKYVIDGKWQCFRSTQQTKKLLVSAGYKKIDFKNDNARMFPTVIAYKV
jgi:SAM-dependent methyltransferase